MILKYLEENIILSILNERIYLSYLQDDLQLLSYLHMLVFYVY